MILHRPLIQRVYILTFMRNETQKENLNPGGKMFWLGFLIKKRYPNYLKKQKHLQDRRNERDLRMWSRIWHK